MISEDLKRQLLALSPEEAQEVREFLDEVSVGTRRKLIEEVRTIRARNVPTSRSAADEVRTVRDEGWR